MTFVTGFKKFVWIGAAGITGAFVSALIGIVLLFIIGIGGAIIAAYVPFGSHFVSKWTLEGVYITIISASGVGLILGCFAIRRHQQVIQKWFAPLFILGVFMAFGLWLVYNYANHVEFIREVKLADCNDNILKINLNVPKGRNYCLVLATPEITNYGEIPSYTFSGRVHISDHSSSVVDFPISSDRSQQDKLQSVLGLSLTGSSNTNCPSLSRFIQAEGHYSIEIVFDKPPPPSTSIWLKWAQARKDREK
jgi:hypothetical protein